MKALAEIFCKGVQDGVKPAALHVEVGGAGGDWDTSCIQITYKDDFVQFCGFNTGGVDAYGDNRDDVEAEMIEMSSCHADSGDGVDTKHEALMLASWRLKQRLEQMGWCVVGCMKNYH